MEHNHVTRDIKPSGECPACDLYWSNDHEHCTRCPACGLHKHKGTCEDFINKGQPAVCKEEHA